MIVAVTVAVTVTVTRTVTVTVELSGSSARFVHYKPFLARLACRDEFKRWIRCGWLCRPSTFVSIQWYTIFSMNSGTFLYGKVLYLSC